MDDDGGLTHTIQFDTDDDDTNKYDTVIIRHQPDDSETMTVLGYEDDDVTFQCAVETRELSFKPVSILGRGEAESLLGVSELDPPADTGDIDQEAIPPDISTVFNNLGMALVPQGEWWLDGE